MSGQEIIEKLIAAGCWIHMEHGQAPRLMGPVNQELVDLVKGNRDQVLDAWESYEKDRYCKLPGLLALKSELPTWRSDVYRRVEGYIRRQGTDVAAWVMNRALLYRDQEKAWDMGDCTRAALRDLLYWQLGRFREPEFLLKILEESHEQKNPSK